MEHTTKGGEMTPDIRPMLGGTSEEPTEGTSVTLTPIAKAEAAREELEKFAAWIEAEWFDNVDTPNEVVEFYLRDLRNGWKPEA